MVTLSYRIVPSHQSTAQVWFDCIAYFQFSTLMLHFHGSPRSPHMSCLRYLPLGCPFLLEAGEAHSNPTIR